MAKKNTPDTLSKKGEIAAKEVPLENGKDYRTLFENMTQGVFYQRADGVRVDCNPAVLDLFGLTRDQFLGKTSMNPHWKMIDADGCDLPAGQHPSIQALQTGKPVRDVIAGVFNPLRKNYVWLSINAIPQFRVGENTPFQVFVTLQDITKEKLAKDGLIEEQNFVKSIINTAQVIIMVLDVKGRVVRFNPYMEEISGYALIEVQGKDWFSTFLPEKDHDKIRTLFQRAVGDIKTRGNVNPIVTKDGRELLIEWYDRTLKDGDGNVVGLLSIGQDITDRKQAQEALQESEEKYRSMMESMKDAVYICSPEFRITYMSPKMIRRLGYDATGELCYKAIYGCDEKCSWCIFDQVRQGEHVEYELENPGDNRYYSITNSPITHSDGSVSKLAILRDITAKKAMEEQLRQARKMESIGTMAGGIAHDFNNILFMITGNAELAMEDMPEWNPVRDNLKEIKSAGLRAAGIVKQLLNFSRQTDQKLKPIGAVTVLKNALKLLRSTLPASIEIRKNLPDTETTILGDPSQINQVMMNLCINASQAMEAFGGSLYIAAESITLDETADNCNSGLTPGDYLKITVRDTGPGIEPKILSRIFDPYFTTRGFSKGSGMGLTVVHGIVRNHNGAIAVDSQPGEGVTFTMLFPIVAEKMVMDAAAPGQIPRGAGEKILFIDDEVSIAKMGGMMLESLGYKAESRTSPLEALERFQSNPNHFDLVITDMTMPQMTGINLFEKLRKARSDIPVIICTGHSSLIDEAKAKEIGLAGYTMKPIVMGDIAETIRKVLDEAKGVTQ